MISPALEQDLQALLATLEEHGEAAALAELLALAARVDWVPEADDDYAPFVYPH